MMNRKTAAGIGCPTETWRFYVTSLLDKENARATLRGVLVKNKDNPEAIKELRELLCYRQDLLDFIDKIIVLL